MKDEIKVINIKRPGQILDYVDTKEHLLKLYKYITNLQEKSNNQAKEINRLYKQREKFMKKYSYLQEENERLKEDMKIKDDVISINYNKDTKEYILDRKNYYKINKRLDERLDYKSRNEKAIEYVEHHKFNKFGDIDCGEAEEIINILNGDDE